MLRASRLGFFIGSVLLCLSAEASAQTGGTARYAPDPLDRQSAAYLKGEPYPSVLVIGIAPGWGYRWYKDHEPSWQDKAFAAKGIPMWGANAELYPFARGASPSLGKLGFTFAYARAFGFQSYDVDTIVKTDSGGAKQQAIDTTYYHYELALRYRHVRLSSNFLMGVSAGLERSVFQFGVPSSDPREIPTARYTLATAVTDWRYSFGPAAALFELGLVYPASLDGVSDREAKGFRAGARGSIGAAVSLSKHFEVQGLARYTMVTYGLAPLPGRSDAAGRVWDEYLAFTLNGAASF